MHGSETPTRFADESSATGVIEVAFVFDDALVVALDAGRFSTPSSKEAAKAGLNGSWQIEHDSSNKGSKLRPIVRIVQVVIQSRDLLPVSKTTLGNCSMTSSEAGGSVGG